MITKKTQTFSHLGDEFNGTSTQKDQFMPTAGQGNWQKMAKDINAKYLTVYNNDVTLFTVQHSRYTNATTSYLIVCLFVCLFVA